VWHHSHHDKHNHNSTSLINSERTPTSILATHQHTGTSATSSNSTPNKPSISDSDANQLVPHAKENVRLPRSLKPLAYDLKLIPFMFEKNFTFNGDVKILFEVLEECDNITLHAESLKIGDHNVEVYLHQNTTNQTLRESAKIGKKKQYFVESKQFYVIEMSQKLKKGSVYELVIRFTGVLNDYLQGFYRSSYSDGNNVR
jgi:aminopeptidase N